MLHKFTFTERQKKTKLYQFHGLLLIDFQILQFSFSKLGEVYRRLEITQDKSTFPAFSALETESTRTGD